MYITNFLIFIALTFYGEMPGQYSVRNLTPRELSVELLTADSLFWESYNNCDLAVMSTFFTEDLEFYHDQGGLTTSLSSFIESMKNGICANEDYSMRRAAVEGTVKVYPLNNYGAIITGEHFFYIREKGRKERLDSSAKFTHVWEYKDNTWKMSRVLSYDHQAVAYVSNRKEILLSDAVLDQYSGQYQSSQIGAVAIHKEKNTLLLQAGNLKITLYPEMDSRFFAKERDLQFEFVKATDNKILRIIIYENGDVVDEAKRME